MSDESQFTKGEEGRSLRENERLLLVALLSGRELGKPLIQFLDQARVTDLKDGGMGSIRFKVPGPRRFGKTLVEARYVDADGVLVSISLSVDEEGNLFEMDFWKVDFSPLRRYPVASDLELIEAS
jgi:hypothetical protein